MIKEHQVAGLLPATEGEVWIDGERIDSLPPEKRGFGMVFQNYALFPHMTVFENVSFGLRVGAADRFGNFTRSHINKQMPIVLDGRIESAPVKTMTLKKFARGSGAASRDVMKAAVHLILGRQPIDDNEADAVHVAMWAAREYGG